VIKSFFTLPEGIEQEDTIFLDPGKQIKTTDESLIVTGNKVFLGHQILAVDGSLAKTQVATGDTAALFAIVLEVTLDVHICMITDDLDGVLIGTNGTV